MPTLAEMNTFPPNSPFKCGAFSDLRSKNAGLILKNCKSKCLFPHRHIEKSTNKTAG